MIPYKNTNYLGLIYFIYELGKRDSNATLLKNIFEVGLRDELDLHSTKANCIIYGSPALVSIGTFRWAKIRSSTRSYPPFMDLYQDIKNDYHYISETTEEAGLRKMTKAKILPPAITPKEIPIKIRNTYVLSSLKYLKDLIKYYNNLTKNDKK